MQEPFEIDLPEDLVSYWSTQDARSRFFDIPGCFDSLLDILPSFGRNAPVRDEIGPAEDEQNSDAVAVQPLQTVDDRVPQPRILEGRCPPAVGAVRQGRDLRFGHRSFSDEIPDEAPIDLVLVHVVEWLALSEVSLNRDTLNVRPEGLLHVRDKAAGLRVADLFRDRLHWSGYPEKEAEPRRFEVIFHAEDALLKGILPLVCRWPCRRFWPSTPHLGLLVSNFNHLQFFDGYV